jgi:hypothetical protein
MSFYPPKSAYTGTAIAGSQEVYPTPTPKPKMKKTLKQKFKEWLFEENNQKYNQDICIDKDVIDFDRSIRFKIFNANGGRVIETASYDDRTDRNKRSLYVITSDQDFGREIDKILTMEALR